jgi:hypothetical protein
MGNLTQARKLREKLGIVSKDEKKETKSKPLDKQNREELITTAKALGIEIKEETKAQIIELIKAAQK